MGGYFFRGGTLGIALGWSIQEGSENGRLFSVVWEIGLHWHELVFKGRMASMDGVIYDVESLISC